MISLSFVKEISLNVGEYQASSQVAKLI